MDNGNTDHYQGIGIILCHFTKCSIIYPVVTVCCCPGQPSNTISPGALKFYVGFKMFTSEPLEYCDFVDPKGSSWISPYQTPNNLYYFKIEIFKVSPQSNRNIVVPNVCAQPGKTSLRLFINNLGVSIFTD